MLSWPICLHSRIGATMVVHDVIGILFMAVNLLASNASSIIMALDLMLFLYWKRIERLPMIFTYCVLGTRDQWGHWQILPKRDSLRQPSTPILPHSKLMAMLVIMG